MKKAPALDGGLNSPGSATTSSMTYAMVTRNATWSTLTGTRNSPATSLPQDQDIMLDREITQALISPDQAGIG